MITIVAFTQNQYFRDPVRVKEIYEKNPALWESLNRKFMFGGCLSGRRLQETFGWDMCNQIIWDTITTQIGDRSNSVFPVDPQHIRNVMAKHNPSIILSFGVLAREAIQAWCDEQYNKEEPTPIPVIISGPHPASRYGDVRFRLWEMNEELVFKQWEIFGIDPTGKYDYSRQRQYEPIKQASI